MSIIGAILLFTWKKESISTSLILLTFATAASSSLLRGLGRCIQRSTDKNKLSHFYLENTEKMTTLLLLLMLAEIQDYMMIISSLEAKLLTTVFHPISNSN